MRFKFYYWLLPVLFVILYTSCRKNDNLLTVGGDVSFSTDTLSFDTVFTAAGSFTNGLLIYNKQNQPIELSSVRLKRGDSSFFKLNVDGFSGNEVKNIKIRAKDSAYVFATVNIDPTNELSPFLVTDELIVTLNGKEYTVPFTAFGQNAHYVVKDSITTNTTWLTDKPYVVINACVIGAGATLNIPANCKVYMHQNARFFVYGNLNINPTGVDSVVFQGDRLDRAYFGYRGYPGEWGGFYFVNGSQGVIKNAVIKNCGGSTPYYNYGIQPAAIEVDSGAKLTMERTVVKNVIGHGIYCFQGNITATNTLVHNCGGQALAIIKGGIDSFTNCTFANYGNYALSHINNPTLGILNWIQISQNVYEYGDLDVVLRNCIVWGSLDSEMVCDTSGTAFLSKPYKVRLLLDHCDLKRGNIQDGFVNMVACIRDDPQFIDPISGDLRIPLASPAATAGTNSFLPVFDLDGVLRSGNAMGCYQPK